MSNETPVIDVPSPETKAAEAVPASSPVPEVKASPAQDLRDIQALLVTGIFQGNMAPALCKAYQLLELMAKKVENDAKKPS